MLKYSNVLNGDVRETFTGSSCGTPRGLNNRTFLGHPWNVGHKHIELTLTGYSRLYSEW